MSTVRHISRRCVLVVGFFLLAGCMADPMPSPNSPDRNRMILSASTAVRGGGALDLVALVGLDGAVDGAGFVEIRQRFGESRTIVRSGETGTFAAIVSAAANDPLLVTFREQEDGPASSEVEITVTRFETDAENGSPETPAAIGADDNEPEGAFVRALAPAEGRAQIEGAGFAAGLVVAVGNTRTGEVVEATTNGSGAFTATIGAAAGDTLVAIAQDGSGGLTSGAAALAVPVP